MIEHFFRKRATKTEEREHTPTSFNAPTGSAEYKYAQYGFTSPTQRVSSTSSVKPAPPHANSGQQIYKECVCRMSVSISLTLSLNHAKFALEHINSSGDRSEIARSTAHDLVQRHGALGRGACSSLLPG